MATLLTCRQVCKAYGTKELFSDLSIGFADDERVGFLGPNGAGKTTFLKILAGIEKADRGEVNMRRGARVGYLPQDDRFPEGGTVYSVLIDALADHDMEPYERDTEVAIIITKFGFPNEDQPVEELSGGWRKRLSIARQVIRTPDLLLMDEPTNHLDIEGIVWLEELLIKAPFAFLAVSHDRYFLERVTTRVVELNPIYPEGCFSVSGTYSMFLDKRADFLESQKAQQETLANIVRREAAFLKSNSKAQRTKSKSRIDEAYRLHDELRELQGRNAQTATAGIAFDGTGRQTKKLIEATGLAKSLGGRTLFHDISVTLAPGTRLGLVGNNGSGKTTFIRVLTGDLPADEGKIKNADALSIVLFDQRREELPQEISLRRALAPGGDSVVFRGRPTHVTAWAKRFLFRVEQLDMPVRDLSGGEQARILIARLMLKPADVLVLDEPTNDLDISSLDILEESLADFPGAIVLVTHDRFMLDRICNEVVGFDGVGGARTYANCAQWESDMDRRAAEAEASAKAAAKRGGAKAGEAKRSGDKSKSSGITAAEQKELQTIEATIREAEAEVEKHQRSVEDPAIAANHVELEKRWASLETARKRVETLYARWTELESRAGGG
jgi:ATP-binding cassette subfamily F protein uup